MKRKTDLLLLITFIVELTIAVWIPLELPHHFETCGLHYVEMILGENEEKPPRPTTGGAAVGR